VLGAGSCVGSDVCSAGAEIVEGADCAGAASAGWVGVDVLGVDATAGAGAAFG
jgi:hypothetical protein